MKKKILVICLMAGLLFGSFGSFNYSSAYDGGISEYKFAKKMQVVKAGKAKYFVNVKGKLKGGKITKITSSKKSVVKPMKTSRGYLYDGKYIAFQAKKTGKATLKVTIKKGNKTRTIKTTVKVVKYTNPFQSFKVNNKEMKSLYDNDKQDPSFDVYDLENKKAIPLKIVPKKGWKVVSVEELLGKKFKNNSTIDTTALDSGIYVRMYNKKKNLYIDRYLGFLGNY